MSDQFYDFYLPSLVPVSLADMNILANDLIVDGQFVKELSHGQGAAFMDAVVEQRTRV